MIRDLDGADVTVGRATPRWLLPAGTAACVAAFIVALVTFRPGAPQPGPAGVAMTGADQQQLGGGIVVFDRTGGLSGPVLDPGGNAPGASRTPTPTLSLPQGTYLSVTRVDLAGTTGLISSGSAEPGLLFRYRLTHGRDLLLARYSTDLVHATTTYVMEDLRVRGTDGRLLTAKNRDQATVLTWREDRFYYQLVSATLSGAELVALAERLR